MTLLIDWVSIARPDQPLWTGLGHLGFDYSSLTAAGSGGGCVASTELLDIVRLTDFAGRKPAHLSGASVRLQVWAPDSGGYAAIGAVVANW